MLETNYFLTYDGQYDGQCYPNISMVMGRFEDTEHLLESPPEAVKYTKT